MIQSRDFLPLVVKLESNSVVAIPANVGNVRGCVSSDFIRYNDLNIFHAVPPILSPQNLFLRGLFLSVPNIHRQIWGHIVMRFASAAVVCGQLVIGGVAVGHTGFLDGFLYVCTATLSTPLLKP